MCKSWKSSGRSEPAARKGQGLWNRNKGRRPRGAAGEGGSKEGKRADGGEPGERCGHHRGSRGHRDQIARSLRAEITGDRLGQPAPHFAGRTEGGAVGLGFCTSLLPRAPRSRRCRTAQGPAQPRHRTPGHSGPAHTAAELNVLKPPSRAGVRSTKLHQKWTKNKKRKK